MKTRGPHMYTSKSDSGSHPRSSSGVIRPAVAFGSLPSVQGEHAVGCRQTDLLTDGDLVVQVIGHDAFGARCMQARLALDGDSVAAVARYIGDGVVTRGRHRLPGNIHVDGDVLAGQVLGQRTAVGRRQDEGGDPVGLLCLGADGEGPVPGPPAGLIELLLVELGFAADADVGEVAVGLGDRSP